MLLYKAAFEHEGFKLAVGENDIEIIDIFDHFAHLYGVVMLGAEILADAVFECLRFADIYYLRAAVFHQIDPGSQRKLHRLFAKLFDFRIHSLTCLLSAFLTHILYYKNAPPNRGAKKIIFWVIFPQHFVAIIKMRGYISAEMNI